jgi:ParB family transcriptional regulator, chromosome partitioning protein
MNFCETRRGSNVMKNKGLGQGVGVLFSSDDDDELYFECNIDSIRANTHQPRSHFNEEDLDELADSIKEHGVLQPLIVVRRNDSDENYYEIIAGERRFRASKKLGLATVPVVVRDIEDENKLLELALIENIQRTDLNPMEEAEAYQKLINKFNYTQEEAAKRLGKNRSTVANILRLLNLPDFVQQDLIAGILSEGHARPLLRLGDNFAAMKEVRDQIVEKKLSVRQTELLVKKFLKSPQQQTLKTKKKPEEIPPSYCASLVNQLTNKLSSKVSIQQNGSRGKIEIEYYSLDDLERVIGLVMNEDTP